MDNSPPGIRRVCVAVDIEKHSGHSTLELADLQRQMYLALAQTCSSSELGRTLLNNQDTDDGEIIFLPVGIDEPRAITLLVNGLFRALDQINRQLRQNTRLRLRTAVHEGITTLVADTFAGRAVTKTCRLLGSQPLRVALAHRPDANLAVMLSDEIYEDLGSFDHCLPPGEFQRVEIDDPSRRRRDIGWIIVPERTY